jgi:uncharacterized membrane protein
MASNAAADYRRVPVTALGGWLERGWEHFAATKAISMSFSAVFLLPWLAGVYVLLDRGVLLLGYALVGGFVLLGPVLVTGFYRAAARRRAGTRPRLADLWAGLRSAPPGVWFIAFVTALIFLIWITDAVVVYSLYLGVEPVLLRSLVDDALLRQHALLFLGFGTLMGFFLAAAIFLVSAFSVPLVFHRRQEFVAAVLLSVRAVFGNFVTMSTWGLTIAVLLFFTLLVAPPLFVVAFPVLAYAGDEAYREVWASEGDEH